MVKRLTFFLVALAFQYTASIAQVFPVGENGKVTFYEVLPADSLSKVALYHNAINWFKKSAHQVKLTREDSVNGKLMGHNEFLLYSAQPGVLKKLTGKFTYETVIEVRDNRYRYTFTDFIYHEFKPDRYHNIAATGKTKNLEELKATGWQKLWDKHRQLLFTKIQQDIDRLKTQIIHVPTATPASTKKNELKWEE